jgi:hypothetical protein
MPKREMVAVGINDAVCCLAGQRHGRVLFVAGIKFQEGDSLFLKFYAAL